MSNEHEPAAVRSIVRDCWSSVLEISPDEVDDYPDFFAAGGDSLLAVELIATLSERLGVDVPLDPLLFEGTFSALADACCAAIAVGHTP